jgi:hypothetical protein
MSLPFASPNAQNYLQAGYGLACAVAIAEMALFVGSLSVWFDPLEALSLRFDPLEAPSLRFDHLEALPLQFDHLEALPLRFDHAEVGFGAFI